MDLASHARTKRGIDELMTRDAALARELGGDNERLEVRVIVSAYAHCSLRESRADQVSDFVGSHQEESRPVPGVWPY